MSKLLKFSTLPLLLAIALFVSSLEAAAPSVAVPENVLAKSKLKMAKNETAIYVGDMHCGHCAKKIAGKLYTVKGVLKVRTDVKADVVIVTPQKKKKLDPMALWAAADKSGFPAIKLIGPTGTYTIDAETKKVTKVVAEVAAVPGA
jgi:copper chaperone CopZ